MNDRSDLLTKRPVRLNKVQILTIVGDLEEEMGRIEILLKQVDVLSGRVHQTGLWCPLGGEIPNQFGLVIFKIGKS